VDDGGLQLMKASVCMASFNRSPRVLRQVLESICSQTPPFEFEVIVVDDGSEFGATDVCDDFPVTCIRIDREPVARNASVARNIAYHAAMGDIVIAQSDDVVHQQKNSIEVLCRELEDNPQSFIIANVLGCDEQGTPNSVYTGIWKHKRRHKPLLFLGSLHRADLYAVGGEDEDFEKSGGHSYEDIWFADCLMNGQGLTPLYTRHVIGHHIGHPTRISDRRVLINKDLYYRKRAEGKWCSASGSWKVEK
jgi:glycosyltransferase involved in cell wall biosynthesis